MSGFLFRGGLHGMMWVIGSGMASITMNGWKASRINGTRVGMLCGLKPERDCTVLVDRLVAFARST